MTYRVISGAVPRRPRIGVTAFAIGLLAGLMPLRAAVAEPFSGFHETLAAGTERAKLWQTGWTAFYAASTAFNAYRGSEASDADDRFDARVSAVTSAMGLGDMLLSPLPPVYEAAQAQYRGATGNPDRRRELLLRLAQSENTPYRWQSRIAPGLVNAAAGLVIGLGDNRPEDGVVQFATGMLVNEIKLWTRPTHVRRQLRSMGEVTLNLGGTPADLRISGYLLPYHAGVLVRF